MTKIYTDKQKIKLYLDFKGISKNSFYKKVGLSVGFLDSGSSLGVDKLRAVVDNYPDLSVEWIVNDRGEMIKTNTNNSSRSTKGIPLLPIDAIAGMGDGEQQVMDYEGACYVIPELEDLGAEYLIRVRGDSMTPKYETGDILGCKKLSGDTFFQWNNIYVLSTDQGGVVKRVQPSGKEDVILCVSDNAAYPPFELHRDQWYSISIVVGKMRIKGAD